MALFHRATVVPTKQDLIADWAPRQPWGPAPDSPIEVVGSYRFDDPDGAVGMETFVVRSGDGLFQVALTYRDAPLDGGEGALITTMEHSVLGTRWVYDGLGDPRYVVMLASVTMTGQGEALGMVEFEGRWVVAPSPLRIQGGGWTTERVPVDGFTMEQETTESLTLVNDRFTLLVHRRPQPGPRPPIGLTATWPGQTEPVVLAEVRERGA